MEGGREHFTQLWNLPGRLNLPLEQLPGKGSRQKKGGIQLLGALLVQTCSWEASKAKSNWSLVWEMFSPGNFIKFVSENKRMMQESREAVQLIAGVGMKTNWPEEAC